MEQTSELWVAGRPLSSSSGLVGPFGAPRLDGLDPRWSMEGFLAIVTAHPELLPAAWSLMRDTWDQGHRSSSPANPYLVPPEEVTS